MKYQVFVESAAGVQWSNLVHSTLCAALAERNRVQAAGLRAHAVLVA
ncbi:hypothetical protein [Cupriavidus necator]